MPKSHSNNMWTLCVWRESSARVRKRIVSIQFVSDESHVLPLRSWAGVDFSSAKCRLPGSISLKRETNAPWWPASLPEPARELSGTVSTKPPWDLLHHRVQTWPCGASSVMWCQQHVEARVRGLGQNLRTCCWDLSRALRCWNPGNQVHETSLSSCSVTRKS